MTWEMLQSGSFSLKPRFEAYSGEFAKISSLLTSPPKLPENRKLTASYIALGDEVHELHGRQTDRVNVCNSDGRRRRFTHRRHKHQVVGAVSSGNLAQRVDRHRAVEIVGGVEGVAGKRRRASRLHRQG